MRLTKFLSPDTHEGFVGSLGCGIHGLTSNTEAGTSGRDEHNAAALREMRLSSLGQENRTADVAVEMGLVELGGGVDEVRLVALGSAGDIALVHLSRSNVLVLRILVNDNLDLASLGDLQSRVDEEWDLIKVADVGFAQDGFRSDFLDVVDHLLGTPCTTFRHVVHDDICAPFGKQDGNAGTKATAIFSSAESEVPMLHKSHTEKLP